MQAPVDLSARTRSRRTFLTCSLAACSAGVPVTANAQPPPETGTIRLTATPAICLAPQYVAEALLIAEGFSDVQYVISRGTGWRFLNELKTELKA